MNENFTPELFGEKIKILRKKAKYTQEDFSELIGIEPQNLSRIERGLNFPSLVTFINISQVLNIEPNDLLDVDYLCNENELEEEIIAKLKTFSIEDKRLLYRFIKNIVN